MSRWFQNVWFSVGLIVASFAAAGATAYRLVGDLGAQAQAIAGDRLTIQQNTNAIGLMANLKRVAPQVQSAQRQLNRLLPTKDELINFSQWVKSLARANQIDAAFNFQGAGSAATGENAGFVAFTLDLNGSYSGIKGFLAAFEAKSPQFLAVVDSLDVTVQSDGRYRVAMPGRVFYQNGAGAQNSAGTATTTMP
jgi:hypothetical protein